ncbi:hypothetical protein [Mycetohabitans sp. B46]|uniref:hypothetical protein n=1 Tax=Mycetohabitans sp. B46 TaxID=2772536 RepID=UPI0030A8B258
MSMLTHWLKPRLRVAEPLFDPFLDGRGTVCENAQSSYSYKAAEVGDMTAQYVARRSSALH